MEGRIIVTESVERTFRFALRHGPAAPACILDRMTEGIEQLVDEAPALKRGDRCTVVRVDGDGRPLVLKRYNLKGPAHTLVHLFLRSRAAWCWRNGHRLLQAGLATPEPLACWECRAGPLRLQSYLLTEFVPGPTLLARVGEAEPTEIDRLAAAFARVWRLLGELRAGHDDMKATNFIAGGDGRLWLVDLDGMRIGLPAPFFRRARRRDLARFMRNWRDRPEVAAAFRARIDTT